MNWRAKLIPTPAGLRRGIWREPSELEDATLTFTVHPGLIPRFRGRRWPVFRLNRLAILSRFCPVTEIGFKSATHSTDPKNGRVVS